jgi:hypothetical protein
MPKPNKGESREEFVSRYMSDPKAKKDFPDEKQRLAVAYSEYKKNQKSEELFFFKANISRIWTEEVEINKSAGQTEKSSQTFIEATVSGLKEDRDNEMMSQEAINDMIDQFKSGTIPFFPDHGFHEQSGQKNVYSWKQMMGCWTNARQEDNSLKAICRLNKAHPDFELFKAYVEEGMPIGFSVGGKVSGEPYFIELNDEPEVEKEINEKNN